MDFNQFQEWSRERFVHALSAPTTLPTVDAQRLQQAMDYSLRNGGKRIRPLLVYATAHSLNGNMAAADICALAVEMIHAYSLVHDDLPAMDNDDLRRGKPTCHIAFDEATAILAGDALQTQAFELLSQPMSQVTAQQQLAMVNVLANASGMAGMAGGQSLDLSAVNQEVDLAYLETMHNHKTGALIIASVTLGAICANADEITQRKLITFARAIGLAFQVQDDILDVIGDTHILGKPQGSDALQNKPTYVSILGIDGAKSKAQALFDTAINALDDIEADTQALKQIAHYIIKRAY